MKGTSVPLSKNRLNQRGRGLRWVVQEGYSNAYIYIYTLHNIYIYMICKYIGGDGGCINMLLVILILSVFKTVFFFTLFEVGVSPPNNSCRHASAFFSRWIYRVSIQK